MWAWRSHPGLSTWFYPRSNIELRGDVGRQRWNCQPHTCVRRTAKLKPPRQAKAPGGWGLSQPWVRAALVSINTTRGKCPGCGGCHERHTGNGRGEVTAPGQAQGRGAQGRSTTACGEELLWGRVRDLRASWTFPRPDSSAARCSSMLLGRWGGESLSFGKGDN